MRPQVHNTAWMGRFYTLNCVCTYIFRATETLKTLLKLLSYSIEVPVSLCCVFRCGQLLIIRVKKRRKWIKFSRIQKIPFSSLSHDSTATRVLMLTSTTNPSRHHSPPSAVSPQSGCLDAEEWHREDGLDNQRQIDTNSKQKVSF